MKTRMGAGTARVARNAVSVLASDAFSRASIFALYALIGRRIGADAFGQMSLALTFFYLVQTIAGVKTLVTRDLAKDRSQTDHYIANGIGVALFLSGASLLVLVVVVQLLGYPRATSQLILLVCAGLVPYALASVFEGVFRAHERMGYIALATIPASVFRVVAAVLVLAGGGTLTEIAVVLLVSQAAITAIEWMCLLRVVGRPRVAPRLASMRTMTGAALPFLGIELLVAITTSVNVLLLSKLGTDREVGLYTAATQLTNPLWLVLQSVVLSVFPIISRKYEAGPEKLTRSTRLLTLTVVSITLPPAVAGVFEAGDVLHLVYGRPDFTTAGVVFSLALWQMVIAAVTLVLGQVLYAGFRERLALRIVAIDTAAMVLLGTLLIQVLGLLGAALTSLAVASLEFAQHYRPVARLLPELSLFRVLAAPFAAAGCALALVALVGQIGLLVPFLVAALVYVAALLAFGAWRAGGARALAREGRDLWTA